MTDHRRLQRTLFRMQADAAFAQAVFARDASALETTGLDAEDLELLLAADPAGVRADRSGKRRLQVAANAASEFTLTLAEVARTCAEASFLLAFLSSPEFHGAIAEDARLPLAFAAYGLREADEKEPLRSLLRLEEAMALARRGPPRDTAKTSAQAPSDDELRLTPAARVVELAAGTLAHADALRRALDEGRALPPFEPGEGLELVLIHARPGALPPGPPEVSVEVLAPPADDLFRAAREPLSREARARFAREHGASPAELERFLEPFVVEGVLEPTARP